MKTRLTICLLALLSFPGCAATLKGGGELAIGMRNDNFLVIRSTVDGDKEGKEATVELEIAPEILGLLDPAPAPPGE